MRTISNNSRANLTKLFGNFGGNLLKFDQIFYKALNTPLVTRKHDLAKM